MRRWLAVSLLLFLCSCQPGLGEGPEPGGEPEEAGWPPLPPVAEAPDQPLEVKVHDAPELSGRFWAGDLVCLPPGGRARLKPLAPKGRLSLADADGWQAAGGTLEPAGDGGLELTAPERPGLLHRLDLEGGGRFTLLVLHAAAIESLPRTGGWRVRIAGELLGSYHGPANSPSRLVREHADRYRPPRFFMKLEDATLPLQLAPHLLAGQMVSLTGPKGQPRRRHTAWLPPNRPLIEKLERLSRELQAQGVKFKRLTVNSGFRAPAYNARVGGGLYSRHTYGDAADVMIDENGDERCDDLTGDRVADQRDALVIAQAVRKLELAGQVRPGGIGVYAFDTAESVAAFVHLDARGFMTRWGTIHRRGRTLGLDWWPPEEFKQDEDSD